MLDQAIRIFARTFKNKEAKVVNALSSLKSDNMVAATQHVLTVIGIAAVALLGSILIKPQLAHEIHQQLFLATDDANLMNSVSEFANTAGSQHASATRVGGSEKITLTKEQHARIISWISKRYRVAEKAADMLVSAAYLTGKEVKLDPLLILAVMAIESSFNPFAESSVGAQGLMQVMSKVHHDKFQNLGGLNEALNPLVNIKVGAMILKDYIQRSGSIEGGLKVYVGAALLDSDAGYGSRVLAEYQRLKLVASGEKVPVFSSTVPNMAKTPASPQTSKPAVTRDVAEESEENTMNDKVAAL